MHFGFTSFPGHGHVNPTLPLVEELVRRGHRVSYAVQDDFASAVESAGATVIPISGTAATAPDQTGAPEMAERLVAILDSTMTSFPVTVDHFSADPIDVLCHDAMSLDGPMLAEKLDVPRIALNPTYASNEQFGMRQHMMAAMEADEDTTKMRATMAKLMEGVREKFAAFSAEHSVTPPSFLDATPADLNIVFIPREFQLSADTFDDRFVFVGPDLGGRGDGNGTWTPPPEDAPLLFISLGTAFNNQPGFFRLCLEAFGDTTWQVAMAIGEQVSRADLGPIPGNVEVRSHFPQPFVLRHADVFLSHTGMNSTMESLFCGVPIVAVPQMAEQVLNATQVEELGLGRRLDPKQVSAQVLANAVTEVSADEGIQERATAMASTLRTSGGSSAAADAIEAHLRA